jgi:hypothetical protein
MIESAMTYILAEHMRAGEDSYRWLTLTDSDINAFTCHGSRGSDDCIDCGEARNIMLRPFS